MSTDDTNAATTPGPITPVSTRKARSVAHGAAYVVLGLIGFAPQLWIWYARSRAEAGRREAGLQLLRDYLDEIRAEIPHPSPPLPI